MVTMASHPQRELPGAGKMSAQQLKTIAQKSCGVLRSRLQESGVIDKPDIYFLS